MLPVLSVQIPQVAARVQAWKKWDSVQHEKAEKQHFKFLGKHFKFTIQEEVRPVLSDEKRTLIMEWMAEMDRDIASVDRAIERGIDYGDTPHSMDVLDDRTDG